MVETIQRSADPHIVSRTALPPIALATLFMHLVDTLIPGNECWPSASSVGVHGVLLLRLVEEWGDEQPHTVADALQAAGGPLDDCDPAKRRQIIERFEGSLPDLFDKVRSAVVLAYYESPIVVEAIRKQGRPYLLRPHLTGYPTRPFDTAKDTPSHGRGFYVETDAVQRVDVLALHLETSLTQNWGIQR